MKLPQAPTKPKLLDAMRDVVLEMQMAQGKVDAMRLTGDYVKFNSAKKELFAVKARFNKMNKQLAGINGRCPQCKYTLPAHDPSVCRDERPNI